MTDQTDPAPATATGTATFSDWQEEPGWGPDAPLPRLATSLVTFRYEGDLTATSDARSVLAYGADGTGTGLGFETVTGTLGGRTGGFVLQHEDRFSTTGVATTWTIVEGSGTGALAGITGDGGYDVGEGEREWAYELRYRLPS